ncbi:nitrous oxide reductase accessory protein NosL [Geomonas sp.]|uniref:nitrous oxide reductase accessory protein NosL n=1 Tax=Geomonas sp. TaxID=2651584 RepID=UPI002B4819B7|nr:nitrous oxide reductase accessory protein NosL [Geomonas sp.]HJV36183.1 nitrous oxide reductase accessory protein NosL [Geomonas sp.]
MSTMPSRKHLCRLATAPLVTLALVAAAASALAGIAFPAPAKEVKCPVCGMFVARYPDWTATLVYRDGTRRYFDGPKDLFTYYHNTGRYDPSRQRTEVAGIAVKDYYSLAPVDARQAFFVTGSDVRGPMGSELIPFAGKADAEAFRLDHHGKRVLRFSEVTAPLVKSLQ